MDTCEIRPTTVEGIKRLARTIKKEMGCKHMRALDLAAQQAGYTHYPAAHRALASQPEPPGSSEPEVWHEPEPDRAEPEPAPAPATQPIEVVWKRSRFTPRGPG